MPTLPNEAQTRQQRIDQQLARVGWSSAQHTLIEELRLPRTSPHLAEANTTYQAGDEAVDYVLTGRDGLPLGIVEAKRSSRDALAGTRQAADYADHIRAHYGVEPFIFLANGAQIWFWDRARSPLRLVSGFFTREDLERLAFQRQHRQPLAALQPNGTIVDRLYQHEAIRRVTEALEGGQRSFLLVMATGTGKTRTVIALIDLLLRAKWVQRVLFLADRRELVRQALGDFKEHIPHETRARVENGDLDHSARIHVATYPSIMTVYEQLSPGYYDLIIADESHRSIYNRYRAVLDHFDALQLGLTATPTDYIDHNTFDLFQCPDGLPTFYYPYETAVREGYLVNYRVLEAQTTFQLEGIKAGQLPAAWQEQLTEQGIDLGELDFEGSDLERRVTNTGTNDALVQEFMTCCRKDAPGTLPAKSIIFAISHRHAVELWQSFNRLYPDLQRRGLAQVIDSQMERVEAMLDDFKRKDMPRVAISVDMLDTGVNIPAVQNLVFAKPVFSQVKFWQMIGRGTRLWVDPATGERKADFLIIDHWNNFAYFNMHPEGEIAALSEPLPVRVFRLRLEKLRLLDAQRDAANAAATIAQLQAMLADLPRDNVNVRPYLAELADLAPPAAWHPRDGAQLDHLSRTIAPLLRFLPDVNLPVLSFVARTEQLAVAHLSAQTAQIDELREQIVADVGRLPLTLRDVQAQQEKLHWMMGAAFWEGLTYARVMDVQTTFAPLMRYRQGRSRELITLNLPDTVVSRRWIIYGPGGEGAFADGYREQVEAHVRALADTHPTLIKLRQGEPLSDADTHTLASSLNRPDLFVSEAVLQQVYERDDVALVAFLRHILGLSALPSREEQIKAAFEAFIAARPHFTATQINFLRAVRSAVLRRAHLALHDLEQPPFSRVGPVRRLFSEEEVTELLDFANALSA